MTDAATSCGCDPLRARSGGRQPARAAGPALARRRPTATRSPGCRRRSASAGPRPTIPRTRSLDAWAVVADVVSFYTERIAQEGFLRTATELPSVRRLARAIGYELRPGVAAQAEIAFEVEDAPGAPAAAAVPAGTPVKTIPGQDELPQTFETSAALDACAAWNAVPAATTRPQSLHLQATSALGARNLAGPARGRRGACSSGRSAVARRPWIRTHSLRGRSRPARCPRIRSQVRS